MLFVHPAEGEEELKSAPLTVDDPDASSVELYGILND